MALKLICWLLLLNVFLSSFCASVAASFQGNPDSYSYHLSANIKNFYPSIKAQEYKFHYGEATNFTCHETAENTGGVVVLTHVSKHNKVTRILKNKHTYPLSMYMKLGADNDGDILECAFYQDLQLAIVRLKLSVVIDTRGILTFTVNGLAPPLIKNNHNYYEYKYYIGEFVTVNLKKDNDTYGKEACDLMAHEMPKTLQNYHHFQLNNPLEFGLNKNHVMLLHCTVLRKTDGEQIDITLQFSVRPYEYNPFITGLSMSNIYLQYFNDTKTTIVYNIGNGVLKLFCTYKYFDKLSEATWNYSNDEVISIQNTNSYRSFQFQYGHEHATIQCKNSSSNEVTYLILIRLNNETSARPTSPRTVSTPTTLRPIPTPGTQSVATRSTALFEDVSTTPRPGPLLTGGLWDIVIGVLLVIFLFMLGLWIRYIRKKRLPLNKPTYPSVQRNEPASTLEQANEPIYANQILIEFQNKSKNKTLLLGNNSKASDGPYVKDHNHTQNLISQNSNNNNNVYAVNPQPTKVMGEIKPPNTYVNLLKELKDNNHGYINVDENNDMEYVEPAYCGIIQPKN